MWPTLQGSIVEACNLFIPSHSIVKRSYPMWFIPNIIHQLKCARTLRRRLRRGSNTSSITQRLLAIECSLAILIPKAKQMYESPLVRDFQVNPRVVYNYVRHLSASPDIPVVIHHKNCSSSDISVKVNLFNSFFNSVFTQSFYTHMPTPSAQLSSIEVTTSDVFEALSKLDCSKAVGLDCISGKLLKMCAGSLSAPVTIVFRCLQYGCVEDL